MFWLISHFNEISNFSSKKKKKIDRAIDAGAESEFLVWGTNFFFNVETDLHKY